MILPAKYKQLLSTIYVALVVMASTLPIRGAAQNAKRYLSLEMVVELALMQSPAAKNAANRQENEYWYYRNFKTSFRPSLHLNGSLPNFISTNTPVTQPDGSVSFRNISLNSSSVRLSLNQEIAASGTEIFAASDIMRIRDFERHTIEYNSSPFIIGLHQPIFGFNNKRWSKKIEPLKWEESQKGYSEQLEKIAHTATMLFFYMLRIQTNVELAQSNLKNSQANLEISQIKNKLGKLSDNNYERIKLSVFNARKALSRASMDFKIAEFDLKSFIGFEQSKAIELLMPQQVPQLVIDAELALQQATNNRKDTPYFKRLLLEAQRDKNQAKRNNGLKTNLTAVYGLTKTGSSLSEMAGKQEIQRMVQLTFNIPVLDWGRSASRVKIAESKHELVKYEVTQLQQQFEREVIVQAEQFNLLYEQIESSQQADIVADNGFVIALKQYQNGNLSITDLNISLQEKEQYKRDYINSLSEFWSAYYNIRILTLYDFENNKPLLVENEWI
jgi:outer membrane protein